MIKLLIMDVDGTLTDGKINISQNGEIFKSFNVKDGYGIVDAQKNGLIPIILTGRESAIVTYRAKELNIVDVRQWIKNKLDEIKKIIDQYNVTLDEIAYIGDDLNDLELFDLLKYTFAPHDAYKIIKDNAYKLLNASGGYGAVREAIDEIYLINKNM